MSPHSALHLRRRALLLAAMAAALPAAAASPAGRPAMLVVDGDGRRLALFDDGAEPLRRWPVDGAVRGAPVFTPDGGRAFLTLDDGSVTRHDLAAGGQGAAVHAGADPRGLALSGDGQWLLAAHGAALTLFDAGLQPVRRYPAASLDGKTSSRVAAVFHAAARRSFVVAFETLRELWEIPYDRAAPPIFDGLVHDYRMSEAIATPGFLGVRRAPLEEPFAALALDASHKQLLGAGPAGALDVLNLDVRRRIARLPVAAPSPGLLAAFVQRTAPRLALADADGALAIVDAARWRLVQTLQCGPGEPLWLRTHPQSRDLWVGTQDGDGALLTLVDKDTLEVAGSVPLPGRLLGPAAFSRDGRRLWVSLRRGDGDGLAVCEAGAPQTVRWLATARAPAAWPIS